MRGKTIIVKGGNSKNTEASCQAEIELLKNKIGCWGVYILLLYLQVKQVWNLIYGLAWARNVTLFS